MEIDHSQSEWAVPGGPVPSAAERASAKTRVIPRPSAEGSAPVQRGRSRAAAASHDPFSREAALPIIDEIQRAFEALELGMAPGPAPAPAPAPVARHLTCDLASPLVVGSAPYYRLEPAASEVPAHGYEYRWTVRRRADDYPIWQTVTLVPELRIIAAAPGQYVVEVQTLAGGRPTDLRLSIDHDVEVEARRSR